MLTFPRPPCPTPRCCSAGISWEGKIQLIAFCAFESLVGVFWPSMMTQRSSYVPEEMRSTIINFFRIPLNMFVCIILYNVSSFPLATMFGMCSFFLLVCMACQRQFANIVHLEQAGSHFNEDEAAAAGGPGKGVEFTKLAAAAGEGEAALVAAGAGAASSSS